LEIATSEARGPPLSPSQFLIAASAAFCSRESIVVVTFRPPSNARWAPSWPPPSWSTTCCLIHEVKYGKSVSSRGNVRSPEVGSGSAIAASYWERTR
jgi:hypothetical protein